MVMTNWRKFSKAQPGLEALDAEVDSKIQPRGSITRWLERGPASW